MDTSPNQPTHGPRFFGALAAVLNRSVRAMRPDASASAPAELASDVVAQAVIDEALTHGWVTRHGIFAEWTDAGIRAMSQARRSAEPGE